MQSIYWTKGNPVTYQGVPFSPFLDAIDALATSLLGIPFFVCFFPRRGPTGLLLYGLLPKEL